MRPNKQELIEMLSLQGKDEIEALYKQAYEIKTEHSGKIVYFRGIIELSNICSKNCYYCGIRRDNLHTVRYLMEKDEVLDAAKWAWEQNYGSVVIQAGEREDSSFINYVNELLLDIKKLSDDELGITLSLGEQKEEVFRLWQESGAHRYLLRIETSNSSLYQTLHPLDHSFQRRVETLRTLKKLGWQTGTGVMIGLPGQTYEHLADDVLFFYDEDIDMLGMGPFIPHLQTPLKDLVNSYDPDSSLEKALKMIAVCRIALKDVNIASTTALQALNPTGREMGLLAGANIIMPNITDTKYRANYQLYEGKPCLDENADQCVHCLERRIESIGETVGYNKWGDSPHYQSKHPDFISQN
ncbi:MAG TPA: [FeFe] hydrogenase H-cluster radical SAM maturase HydE [Candidatus Cloacimonadota bacterium]|nr:[FeFe] hydrogenase H-cluster radical SAM maturase HydE [Candidatus Cloacimonadota bacterium]HPS39077.1 [FeFe] hydrogenase H-cluster radical SAM maturase HydE [Candidatus Cloacimonadota bacterium]